MRAAAIAHSYVKTQRRGALLRRAGQRVSRQHAGAQRSARRGHGLWRRRRGASRTSLAGLHRDSAAGGSHRQRQRFCALPRHSEPRARRCAPGAATSTAATMSAPSIWARFVPWPMVCARRSRIFLIRRPSPMPQAASPAGESAGSGHHAPSPPPRRGERRTAARDLLQRDRRDWPGRRDQPARQSHAGLAAPPRRLHPGRAAGAGRLCPPTVRLHSFDASGQETLSRGPVLFAAIGNAPEYGSGIRMLPQAELDDGQLDLCFVPAMPKSLVLRHISIASTPEPTCWCPRCVTCAPARFFWKAMRRLPIYADGEYLCQTPAEISASPEGAAGHRSLGLASLPAGDSRLPNFAGSAALPSEAAWQVFFCRRFPVLPIYTEGSSCPVPKSRIRHPSYLPPSRRTMFCRLCLGMATGFTKSARVPLSSRL